ncbi:androgen-induced gene 1 protein-like isoform X2 [Glandiceps talaboti]
MRERFGDGSGKFKHMTFWNLIFQTFYFGLCCLIDLILSSNRRSKFGRKLCNFRDWFLAAIAFPFGMLVVIMFWGIYAVDRELVFPEWLDKIFPAWLNHIMHTTVLPFLLLEMFFTRHKYPSMKSGITGTLTVGFTYLFWILFLGFYLEIWVYGFLKVLTGAYFVLFFAFNAVFLIILYITGEKINKAFWGTHSVDIGAEMEKVD